MPDYGFAELHRDLSAICRDIEATKKENDLKNAEGERALQEWAEIGSKIRAWHEQHPLDRHP